MVKKIAYYTLKDHNHCWPDRIEEQCEKEMSRYGVIYFEDGSEREKVFKEIVEEQRIDTNRETILSCTNREINRFPFFYLSVQEDRSYGQDKSFDFSAVCGGDGGVLCDVGIKQEKKIIINPKKIKGLDIMAVPNIFNPRVYLISSHLKKLLEEIEVTGCDFIPCLEFGQNYTNEVLLLDSVDQELFKTANYFQLKICESVNSPPRVGNVIKIFSECKKCKTIYGFKSESNPVFKPSDLKSLDFQIFKSYKSLNKGIFYIPGERAIVSSRVLDLLIKRKMKGLTRYLSDPPIQYGIVEIHGVTA